MSYKIVIKEQAEKDLYHLSLHEPKAFQKAECLLLELSVHPKMGIGHPEPLKGDPKGRWSRRITSKHRLVYQIFETEVVVLVLTAYGHYEDK